MRKITRYALVVLCASAVAIAAALAANRTQHSLSERAVVPEAVRADTSLRQATLAGGCFWCTESVLQEVAGVKAAVSGFSGGTTPDPTYDDVASGRTDWVESVQVIYDPDVISFEELLVVYWHSIDPTDAGGQFADRGSQYRPVIFYHNEEQKRVAEASKAQLAETGPFEDPIVVAIEPYGEFYAAEEYHQDYYLKHPDSYENYYDRSGRGPFLERVWGSAHPQPLKSTETSSATKLGDAGSNSGPDPSGAWRSFEMPSDEELRARLTRLQYRVTRKNATERPFQNEYFDNERPGIYVDVVSGEPLFSSTTKFHSGTGWPSFYEPLEPELVVEKKDVSLGMVRTEVRSRHADSHLGHVFSWPKSSENPTGLRYCLNSAALHFIPAGDLEDAGYGEFAHLFEDVASR